MILLHPDCVRLYLYTDPLGGRGWTCYNLASVGRCRKVDPVYNMTHCFQTTRLVFHIVLAFCRHVTYLDLVSPCHQCWEWQHAVADPGMILRLCLFRLQQLQQPELRSKSSERVISSLLYCIRHYCSSLLPHWWWLLCL